MGEASLPLRSPARRALAFRANERRANAFRACARFALLTTVLAGLAQCRRAPAPRRFLPDPSPPASAAALVSPATPNAASSAPTRGPAPLRSCRVIKLTGPSSLRARGATAASDPPSWQPIALGELIDGAKLELPDGAELIMQSTASSREIGMRGPARADVCKGGEEEIGLSYGTVRGFFGPGARPGAEVWIATPVGVVRFSDASLEVEVEPREAMRISVKIGAGRAVFAPVSTMLARDAGTEGLVEVAIGQGSPFIAERPALSPFRLARDLAAACRRQADTVEQTAHAIFAVDAGAFGGRAAINVKARRSARMVCGAARAAAALDQAQADSSVWADLEKAEQKWKSALPGGGPTGERRSD